MRLVSFVRCNSVIQEERSCFYTLERSLNNDSHTFSVAWLPGLPGIVDPVSITSLVAGYILPRHSGKMRAHANQIWRVQGAFHECSANELCWGKIRTSFCTFLRLLLLRTKWTSDKFCSYGKV